MSVSGEPKGTAKTDSTVTTTTTESGPMYATLVQRFTSVKLITLIGILALSTVSAGVFYALKFTGFEWFPQFLLALATGAWSGLLVVLGIRENQKNEGGAK